MIFLKGYTAAGKYIYNLNGRTAAGEDIDQYYTEIESTFGGL